MDRFKEWESPKIEDGKLTQWNWMVQGKDNLQLGEKTDIGAFTYINAKFGVEIQNNVQIGSHCSIYSENTIDQKTGRITLKEGCCIGSHSVILPGVTVGKNSVVGAFSLVKSDLPDGVVAVGVPAKIVRKIGSREEKDGKIEGEDQ